MSHYRRAHYHLPLSQRDTVEDDPQRPNRIAWNDGTGPETRNDRRPHEDVGRTEPIGRGLVDEQQNSHDDEHDERRDHLRPRGRMNADSMTDAPNKPNQPKPRTVSTSSGSTDGATITTAACHGTG